MDELKAMRQWARRDLRESPVPPTHVARDVMHTIRQANALVTEPPLGAFRTLIAIGSVAALLVLVLSIWSSIGLGGADDAAMDPLMVGYGMGL